jgi:RNA-binding protein
MKPSPSELRALKSRAQQLDPVLRIGREGLTGAVLAKLADIFRTHDLVKVKLVDHKGERKTLAAELAEKSGSTLVQVVGFMVVLHKPRPDRAG